MKAENFNRRHYLCTCDELTYENFDSIDRSKCAGGTTAHPVLDRSMIQRLIDSLKRPSYADD